MLAAGSRIGGFEIIGVIGKGGMGVVYRARDLKLRRDVAIKTLPSEFAAVADRLRRFQREAQAIAALNHPNVVTIYGVEESDNVHFIVMELIDGAPLVDLIPPEGLRLDRILAYAISIIDAVVAAHQQAIIHRDLKPANVMVRSDGRVKVLDFGLAKVVTVEADRGDRTTELVTADTAVVGTTGYMSPEQAEGRAVDARSDIFSFGVMLYEMAAGRRPFTGSSSLAILSSILKDEPTPLTELKPALSPDYERIVRRCLSKDPARRFQTALDVRNELDELRQHNFVGAARATPARSRFASGVVMLVAAAIVLAMGAAAVRFGNWRKSPALTPTGFQQLTSQPGAELFGSVSPDGDWVVYTGEGNGNRDIYLQRVGGQPRINLTPDSPADDEEAEFSPDGERIVFRSSRDGGGLFVMGRTGEDVKRLTRAGFNPDWSPDGTQIAYTLARTEFRPQNAEQRGPLMVVAINGGEPRELHPAAMLPRWSPDGMRIAFAARAEGLAEATSNIVTVPAAGGDLVAVTADAFLNWNPVWAPEGDALYFVSNRGGSPNIWRVAIDQRTGQARSEPEAVTTPAANIAHLSISADGRRLAYSAVQETQNIEVVPFDPLKGEITSAPKPVTTGSRFWANPDPSPDGTQVVFYSQISPEGDLYVAAADGSGSPRQLTDGPAHDRVPRWSPDGQWIAMFSDRTNRLQVWKVRADGSELRQVTTHPSAIAAWSPDGRRMTVARVQTDGGGRVAAIIDAGGEADASTQALTFAAPHIFTPNAWSPDGATLAGTPNFTTAGILLYSLTDHRLEQTTDYGEWPIWLPDSRRVMFVARGREYDILDTRTKVVTTIYRSIRDTLGPPRLTRDGRKLFFQRRVTESDIWVATLSDTE